MVVVLVTSGLVARAQESPDRVDPSDLPTGWADLDWSLVHRGIDHGPLRLDLSHQLFTTSRPNFVRFAVGNATTASHVLKLGSLHVAGGRMSAPREIDVAPADVDLSMPTSDDPPPTPIGSGDYVSLAVPHGAILAIRIALPPDLDPTLGEATRGTCYDVELSGAVDGEPFDLSTTLCYGERIPLR